MMEWTSVSVSELVDERTSKRASDRVCSQYNTSGRKETHRTNDEKRMDEFETESGSGRAPGNDDDGEEKYEWQRIEENWEALLNV